MVVSNRAHLLKRQNLQLCVHYHTLNTVNNQKLIPICSMDEGFDSLRNVMLLPILNGNVSYGQVQAVHADCYPTAFAFDHVPSQFTRMPFGFKNARRTLQSMMNIMLSSVKCQLTEVYLGHFFIISRSLDDQMTKIQDVLSILNDAAVTRKW